MIIKIDQALNEAIIAHTEGRLQDADRLYTAILNINKKHPDANHNMGILALGIGKVREAIPFLRTAVEINPTLARFWYSYIHALLKNNQITDALSQLENAKKAISSVNDHKELENLFNQAYKNISKSDPVKANKPRKASDSYPNINTTRNEPTQQKMNELNVIYRQGAFEIVLQEIIGLRQKFPESIFLYNLLGSTYHKLGQLTQAQAAFTVALHIKRDCVEAHYNLGNVFKATGNTQSAIRCYLNAINLKSDFAEAYFQLGNTYKGIGNLKEAIEAYTQTTKLRSDYADAFLNLGACFVESGQIKEALSAYIKAIESKNNFTKALINSSILLEGLLFNRRNKDAYSIICCLLENRTLTRPMDIAPAAISLLKLEPAIKHLIRENKANTLRTAYEEIIYSLSELKLFLKLISVCPLPDLELEMALSNLRSCILTSLTNGLESDNFVIFQSALALHCFTNEYIYMQNENDGEQLQKLEKSVTHDLKNNHQPSANIILCLASFKALNEYPWINQLSISDELKAVYTQQVKEPEEEEKLKAKINSFGEFAGEVTREVAKQYEENPYPRWVNLAVFFEPLTLLQAVNKFRINIENKEICDKEQLNILVAGCGTGQHSITTACTFKDSQILAVDLSMSSLAYAKRKSEELNVLNIEHLQADILELHKLGRKFDIIESLGVLHHMEKPFEGWKSLTDCLEPGGLMRIGLYSEIARKHIAEIKEEIRSARYTAHDADMKYFRTKLIQSENKSHKRIHKSPDFYNLSSFRDLVFHNEEHTFTITKIQFYLNQLGLMFCGFDNLRIISKFQDAYGNAVDIYDLDCWKAYEEENPHTFSGMYQFWCQKK